MLDLLQYSIKYSLMYNDEYIANTDVHKSLLIKCNVIETWIKQAYFFIINQILTQRPHEHTK